MLNLFELNTISLTLELDAFLREHDLANALECLAEPEALRPRIEAHRAAMERLDRASERCDWLKQDRKIDGSPCLTEPELYADAEYWMDRLASASQESWKIPNRLPELRPLIRARAEADIREARAALMAMEPLAALLDPERAIALLEAEDDSVLAQE